MTSHRRLVALLAAAAALASAAPAPPRMIAVETCAGATMLALLDGGRGEPPEARAAGCHAALPDRAKPTRRR